MEIVYLVIGGLVGIVIGYLAHRVMSQSITGMPQGDVDKLNLQINSLTDERARLQVTNTTLEEKLNDQKAEVEGLQKKFETEFENLANKILEEKTQKFTDQNKTNIDAILSPLKDKISDFEKKVNDVYKNESDERNVLKGEIIRLVEQSKQISEGAENLANALKGDTKAQGDWGEFVLESILEKSGLEKDREYFIQQSYKNDDGKYLRPDIIVKLPENKSVVIDSKVSLTAYDSYYSAEGDSQREVFLKQHILSIREHIKKLSPKEYQNIVDINTLDFILMFIPLESAFSLALKNEMKLFDEALEKNIIMVSSVNLTSVLKTVALMWRQEKQNKNAIEIARQGGALYDKFVDFVNDLKKIRANIKTTGDNFDDALRRLYIGKGNIVSKIEGLKTLGAKVSKSLPVDLVQDAFEEEQKSLTDKL